MLHERRRGKTVFRALDRVVAPRGGGAMVSANPNGARKKRGFSVLRLIQWLTRRERLFRWLDRLFGRFNPFLPEHRRDPHATWRALRESEPVYRSRIFAS